MPKLQPPKATSTPCERLRGDPNRYLTVPALPASDYFYVAASKFLGSLAHKNGILDIVEQIFLKHALFIDESEFIVSAGTAVKDARDISQKGDILVVKLALADLIAT